eukprot:IDg2833t1
MKKILKATHNCDKNKYGVQSVLCRTYVYKSNNEECTTIGHLPMSECTKTTKEKNANSFSCLINDKRQTLNNCPFISDSHEENYLCKNAVIACRYKVKGDKVHCFATMKMPDSAYICNELNQIKTPQKAMCKVARGIKWDSVEWLDTVVELSVPTMEDSIAVLYSSETERREVRVRKEGRPVTLIRPMWFAILSLKIITVVSLTALVIYLRVRRHLEPLANNEHGMINLLTNPRLTNPYGSLATIEGTRETELQVFWDGT